MPHPLVTQLRFTRSEFQRALKDLTDEEAVRRFEPMNCISWNVGHLAWQEQRYWLHYGKGEMLLPDVQKTFAYGAPACTPPLSEVQQAWRTITEATDPWLDTLTTEDLQRAIPRATSPEVTFGSLLLRVIYHYWYHIGENMAIRQMLGHTGLPDFVGNLDGKAPYRAE
jgi:uncharacterized damage-inducible protein DinB